MFVYAAEQLICRVPRIWHGRASYWSQCTHLLGFGYVGLLALGLLEEGVISARSGWFVSVWFYLIETTVKRLDRQDMTWSFREPVLLFSGGRLSMSVVGPEVGFGITVEVGVEFTTEVGIVAWDWVSSGLGVGMVTCDCVPLEIARISILVSFCWWGRSWMLAVDWGIKVWVTASWGVEVTVIPEVGMLSWIWECCGVGVGMAICWGMWALLEIDCSSRLVSWCCGSCWSWDESRRSDSLLWHRCVW